MIDSMTKNVPHSQADISVPVPLTEPEPAPESEIIVSPLLDSADNPEQGSTVIHEMPHAAIKINKLQTETNGHTDALRFIESEATNYGDMSKRPKGSAISEAESGDAGTNPCGVAGASDQGSAPERGRRGRGRPPGRGRLAASARKRKWADREEAEEDRDDGREEGKEEGRGAAFSPDEVLSICKAWSLLSSNSVMKTDRMWTQIAQICAERYSVQRSPGSLRVKWHSVQREVQVWLASKKRVQKNAPLGMTSEKAMSLVMRLYRQHAAKKDKNGEMQQAPPFRYQKAAEFLEDCPEFVALCVEGPYTEIAEDSSGREVQVVQRDAPDAEVVEEQPPELIGNKKDGPSQGRPPGTKSQKRDAVRVREEEKSAQILKRIHEEMVRTNDVIERVDRRQEMFRRMEEDYMLLQVLPRDSTEYQEILESMMARRERREGNAQLPSTRESNGHESPIQGKPSQDDSVSQVEDDGLNAKK